MDILNPEVIATSNVPAVFESVVRQSPEHIAVLCEDRHLTYHELNRAANRLANFILSKSKERGEPITLLVPHSEQAIIGLMGILKAGKVYTPIDVSVPPDRNARIIDHAGARMLLITGDTRAAADQVLAAMPEGSAPVEVINLDELPDGLSEENPGLDLTPDSEAVIFYTSGSTGEPKGVYSRHRYVLQLAFNTKMGMSVAEEDRLALLYSYSYGAANMPIFGSLLNGAIVCLYDARTAVPNVLFKWLNDNRISILSTITTFFRHMANAVTEEMRFPALRMLVLSGEPVTRYDVDLFKENFSPPCVFLNVLGATEVGLFCVYKLDHDTVMEDAVMPVGFPPRGTTILLLDEDGQPVPQGEAGEIVVRSASTAEGYWRNPELTATKYRPDPEDPRYHFFSTGDLGRLNAEGALVHLGRKDNQVKIRGYRVEPLEVESVLLDQPGVKDAAVIAREDAQNQKRLAAYIVPESEDNPPTEQALREALQKRLPSFMIPSAFLIQSTFPVNTNGKLDRGKLPTPDFSVRDPNMPYVKARNSTERRLVEIWEAVLGISPIGVTDQFVELGGDSIRALQIFAQIEKDFGKRLPVDVMLTASTIDDLLKAVRQEDLPIPWPSLVPLKAEGTRPPVFVVHGAGGHVYIFNQFAERMDDDQPVYALRAQGLDGKTPPHQTIEDMAAHYIKELTAVQSSGPYYLAGYSLGGKIAYEMACQLHQAGKEVGLIAALDTVPKNDTDVLEIVDPFVDHESQVSEVPVWNRHTEAMRGLALPGKAVYLVKVAGRVIRTQVKQRLDTRDPAMGNLAWSPHRRMRHFVRRAEDSYTPRPYPGKVHLFCAQDSVKMFGDPSEYWKKYVQGEIELFLFPGSHESLHYEPHVIAFAEKFREVLDQAQRQPA